MALSKRMSAVDSSSHAAIIKTLSNKYHKTTNPTGFINLAVAENTLMHDELVMHINNNIRFDPSIFTYGNGGIGSNALRSSMAGFLNRYFRPIQPLDASSLICTNGMTGAIESLAFALADEGEAFLLARPYYGSFPHVLADRPHVKTIGVSFGTIDPFSIDSIKCYETALLQAQALGTIVRGIILCNPHNPLGHCYSPSVLRALMSFANTHKLHIISDEIYALSSWTTPNTSTHPPTPFTSLLSVPTTSLIDPSYIHCLYGTSKDFGASGFRIATIISPHNPSLLACIATRGLFTFPSGPTDTIVSQILSNPHFCDGYFTELSSRLSTAHDFAIRFLEAHNIPYATPGGAALFVWVDLGAKLASIEAERTPNTKTTITNSTSASATSTSTHQQTSTNAGIAARLVSQKVYLANGDASGSERPGWFRMVFSHPQPYVEEGLRRMLAALYAEEPEVDMPVALVTGMAGCCICV